MAKSDHFLPLYDDSGNLYAVMLSAELWGKGQKKLEPIIMSLLERDTPPQQPEPLHEWEDFKAFWDFKYPLCADVTCKGCGVSTENWETDPTKPFTLKSAQLGGLIVFRCNKCNATVRKKHFKDHYCFEFTPTIK